MAKLLNQYNAEIVNGSKVESSHIKQFADAFTGDEAYDIEISGSLTVNGIEIKSGQLSSGTNYITVLGTGTPEENAAELQAAYNVAKTMPRFIGFLGPASPTYIYAGQTFGTYIEGSPKYYKILVDGLYTPYQIPLPEITEAEAKSVRTTVIVAPGEYNFGATAFVVDTPNIDIVSLTGNSDVIISCTEEDLDYGYKYGIKVTANDVFLKGINCKTRCFYIVNNLNNLICSNCIGGDLSFGYDGITVSGTFNNCKGGVHSFGGNGCIASGTFNYCTGDNYSFGISGTLTGTLINCKLTSGTFPIPTGAGKIYNSITGSGLIVNYPSTMENVFTIRFVDMVNTSYNLSNLPSPPEINSKFVIYDDVNTYSYILAYFDGSSVITVEKLGSNHMIRELPSGNLYYIDEHSSAMATIKLISAM